MTNIVNLHKYTRLDIDPDKVLKGAVGELKRVIVLGDDLNDERYFASSTSHKAELLLLIKEFEFKLLNGDFER
jgi:hypothetical protein